MPSPARVDAEDLIQWAARRDSQSELPHLVRQLVLATARVITRIEFRTGTGVHLGGWDGQTEIEDDTPYAPAGPAGWEMGVQESPGSKADSDFEKRALDPGGLDPAASSFVFVSLRRWAGREAWAVEKTKAGPFKQVRALDADDLHAWLEEAVGVHLWLSERLGKPIQDAEPLGEAWTRWSRATRYPVSPALVTAGRDAEVGVLLDRLAGPAAAIPVQADSFSEALAFTAASLWQLSDDQRETVLARSIVVHSPVAGRMTIASPAGLLLVSSALDPGDVAAAVQAGHHVVVALGREAAVPVDGISLSRLRREPAKAALIEMGVEEHRAGDYATLARRGLLPLRRVLAVSPAAELPSWARAPVPAGLLAALLAGSWDGSAVGDQEAISALAEQPYEDIERTLLQLANGSDPPVRVVGERWLLVSRADAWSLLARNLTNADMRRLSAVASAVFGSSDPALELQPEERWLAAIHGKTRPHSAALREGLAETLAQLAAQADRLTLVSSMTGQELATGVAARVFNAANQDSSGRLWSSIADVLPLLAEAAPDAFLDAVDRGTSGVDPILTLMFEDAEASSALFTSSAHTGLLWALEGLAWSSANIGRAALLLARLSRLDPGGRWANRPDNSLRAIFLPWHPQTTAALDERMQVIDMLRRDEGAAAWKLMIALLPRNGDIGENTHSPRWREWSVDDDQPVTIAEWARNIEQLITRLLQDAGTDAERWGELVRAADAIPPDSLTAVVSAVEDLRPASFDDEGRERIRAGVRSVVHRHRRGSDASWALPPTEVNRLAAAYDALEPSDLLVRHRWLFGHRPDLMEPGKGWREERDAVERLQLAAAGEMWHAGGLVAMQRAAESVEDSVALGWALGTRNDVPEDLAIVALLSSDAPATQRFAGAYAAAAA